MTNNNFVKTINFGYVPIRKNFIEGRHLADIELSDGDNAEIRADYRTEQPFAVIFDGNWELKK